MGLIFGAASAFFGVIVHFFADTETAALASDRSSAPEDDQESHRAPLTAAQAQALRKRQPAPALWRVPLAQLVLCAVVALVLVLAQVRLALVWSFLWGAAAVVAPSALFFHRARRYSVTAAMALANLLVAELLKIGLTLALLLAAPRVVAQLSWAALVAGLMVALVAGWPGLVWTGWASRRQATQKCDNQ